MYQRPRQYASAQAARLTLGGLDPVLHRDQLLLELDVLLDEPAVGVLEQLLEVQDAFVAGKQLALGDAGLLLKRCVLVDKLGGGATRRA
jgi:hypothetical protein